MPFDRPAAAGAAHSRRKRQARGERRMVQIMRAAEELIAGAGVQAVSMNAIARQAGISPGSLYQYFSGKGAVVEAVSQRLASQLRQVTGAVPGAGSPLAHITPEATVDRLFDAAVLLARQHPAFPALLATTEQTESNALLEAIEQSLPACGPANNEGVTRELAARILGTGLGLAVHQSDPAVLLRPTRQAVLSALKGGQGSKNHPSDVCGAHFSEVM